MQQYPPQQQQYYLPNNNQQPPVPQNMSAPANAWQTKIFYDESVSCGECAWGFLCVPCATAKAKSDLDGTHPCYNFCCWIPGGQYSWFRSVYGIKNTCGSELMAGIFCTCCVARRMVSEVRIRHAQGNMAGTVVADPSDPRPQWEQDFFGCSSCGFCSACLCPFCQAHDIRKELQWQDKETHDCCFDMCCINPCAMYGQVRNHYKLPIQFLPPVLEDTCMALFCYPCALNQAHKESQMREARKVKPIQGVVAGILSAVGLKQG
jgi:hypothetical protein